MPFLDDLVVILSGDQVATWGVDLFTGSNADIPQLPIDSGTYLASGAVINLIGTGGTAPEYIQNTTLTPAYLAPSVQVTVTANEAFVADQVMDKVMYSLCKIRNQIVHGSWYRWIKPLQSLPIDMGVDKRGQAKRILNFIASYNRRDNL